MDYQKAEKFELGRHWEQQVSTWLQQNQQYVLKVYDYVSRENRVSKAPIFHIQSPGQPLILPDIQTARAGVTHWIEVKSKSDCGRPFEKHPSYRTTGIDLRLWEHYLEVEKVSGLEVHIYFVHFNQREIRAASAKDLCDHPQKYINLGTRMVYWPYDTLHIIAHIDDDDNIVGV